MHFLMKRYIIAVAVSAFLTAGCSVQTHSRGIQKGCGHLDSSNSRPIAVERVSQYYGKNRKPDKVIKLDGGRTEIVYYTTLSGQANSLHWSGWVVYFTFFPVLPLLFPDGHHQHSYVVSSDGVVEECTNVWHQSTDAPRIHF